jgi:hypothetical protein
MNNVYLAVALWPALPPHQERPLSVRITIPFAAGSEAVIRQRWMMADQRRETRGQNNGKENSKPENRMRSCTASPSARRKGVSRHALPGCARPCPGKPGRGVGGVFQKPMREGHPDEQNQHQNKNRES